MASRTKHNNNQINTNMKKMLIPLFILIFSLPSLGQRYLTKTGKVSFYSDAPLEKIEAINKDANCAIDTQSGVFVVKLLMRSFIFEKQLMQEHFNEEYVESDKFPNAFFKGKIENLNQIAFDKEGTYPVKVSGQMFIHGINKNIDAEGTFTITKNGIHAKATFPLKISDFGISIPGAVVGKISENVEIRTDFILKPL